MFFEAFPQDLHHNWQKTLDMNVPLYLMIQAPLLCRSCLLPIILTLLIAASVPAIVGRLYIVFFGSKGISFSRVINTTMRDASIHNDNWSKVNSLTAIYIQSITIILVKTDSLCLLL